MSIAKLSLVSVIGDLQTLDDVISRCLDKGGFHPEKAAQSVKGLKGFRPLSEEDPYAELLTKVTDLGVTVGLNPKYNPEPRAGSGVYPTVTQDLLHYYRDFHSTFREALDALRGRLNFLRAEIDQDEGTLVYLSHLAQIDVDFDELFSMNYIKVRFGRLPLESFQKLAYYSDKPFLFKGYDIEKDYRWGAYFALEDDIPLVDEIFASLYFERIRAPKFLHGTPGEAVAKLEESLARNRAEVKTIEAQFAQLIEARKPEYYKIYNHLRALSDAFGLRRYASYLDQGFLRLFHISGFMEAADADAFAKEMRGTDGVTVEITPPGEDKRLRPPTKLKNGWFAKPFEMFTEMYGLPSYGDVDPTPFVAFTYSLLFGIMFGDLGQGLLLVVVGWLLWKYKKMNLGRIINRIGIPSCIFGAFYGSVFGFEEVLTPFYTQVLKLPGKPLEVMAPQSATLILISAVVLGVVLICTSILIGIYIGFKRRDYERAVFSSNGIAGLLFYGAVLLGASMLLVVGINLFSLPYVLLLIVLPLAVILFKQPLGKVVKGLSMKQARPEDGYRAYLLDGVFELFEVVLSFFSNTMSFLRVGGFVLCHAGMMTVVFTIAEMVGASASPVVIVFGNLFVIGMEGLIVGIQVLRLEFYEMFSRFFDGDGKPFEAFCVASGEQTAQ